MKEVKLTTKNKVALVDDGDYERVTKYGWFARKHRHTFYAQATSKQSGYSGMHRFILGITDPAILIDHENGNGLDNRRSNLRIATNSQNHANRKVVKSQTGFKGVWNYGTTPLPLYVAGIQMRRARQRIYGFRDIDNAVRCYDAMAQHYFGEFARLNMPLAKLPGC